MPTHLFYCDNCETEKQITIQITEELEPPYCHNCEQDMTRQFGVGAIRFIGSGWATNDS